jgi:hypothetical protein
LLTPTESLAEKTVHQELGYRTGVLELYLPVEPKGPRRNAESWICQPGMPEEPRR